MMTKWARIQTGKCRFEVLIRPHSLRVSFILSCKALTNSLIWAIGLLRISAFCTLTGILGFFGNWNIKWHTQLTHLHLIFFFTMCHDLPGREWSCLFTTHYLSQFIVVFVYLVSLQISFCHPFTLVRLVGYSMFPSAHLAFIMSCKFQIL